jgi:hypothetical protein
LQDERRLSEIAQNTTSVAPFQTHHVTH